ncbi:hypothetical protein KKB44_02380 [Candidatus Micrarchaeota archaeon]|nr:hypothetical protein [Candidatus Micrarchaeota archaeon]
MSKILVGEVVHFFSKVNAAALKLSGDLKVGDRISIEHKDGAVVLEQTVESMQIEHDAVQSANAGQDVAIGIDGKVHTGNLVYKIEV